MVSSLRGSVDRKQVESRLLRFVAIDSVNPCAEGGVGEAELAGELAGELETLGIDPVSQRVADGGRDNVAGRLEGARNAPVVMFEAHLDTVGLWGAATTDARSDGSCVYGRGACDTKGSLVSMLEALEVLSGIDPDSRPTVVLVGTIDEECAGTGAQALVAGAPRFDMAVVGEPTGLRVATAHKGVLRFEIETRGTPAHSSKPHLGRSAILDMASVVTRIDGEYVPRLGEIEHPLVGSPTINVSTIHGGTAENVVPSRCVISLDRRVVPGETPEEILRDIDSVLETLRQDGVSVVVNEPTLVTAPLDTSRHHPLVTALMAGRERVLGEPGEPMGMTFGTDASFYGPAGIPSVIFGPGSIDQAHSDDEWVEIDEVARGAEILAEAMLALV